MAPNYSLKGTGREQQAIIKNQEGEKPTERKHEKNKEVGEGAERDFETKIAEELTSLELRQNQERTDSTQAFALQDFGNNGGQELLSIYGVEKVMGVLKQAQSSESRHDFTMLDLIKQLEPDKKKRQELYKKVVSLAGERLGQLKSRQESLQDSSGNEDELTRLNETYDNENLRVPLVSQQMRIELTVGCCQALDNLAGLLKSGSKQKQLAIEQPFFSMRNLVEGQIAELGLLLSSEENHDIYKVHRELRKNVQENEAARIARAIEIAREIRQKIEQIKSQVEGHYADKIRPILTEVSETTQKFAESPESEKIISALAEAMQKSIDELRKMAEKEVEEKTRKLKEIEKRAKDCARPY